MCESHPKSNSYFYICRKENEMGNFSRQLEEKKERKETDKTTRETMGKYFLDLSKLFLTAVTLSALSPWFTNNDIQINWEIVIIGAIICIVFALLGYRILKQK